MYRGARYRLLLSSYGIDDVAPVKFYKTVAHKLYVYDWSAGSWVIDEWSRTPQFEQHVPRNNIDALYKYMPKQCTPRRKKAT